MSRASRPLFLALICHAATPASRHFIFSAEDDLDERAKREVRKIAPLLSNASVTVASPARCAVEIATILSAKATAVAELRDCDFGTWRGMSLTDVERADPEGLSAWLSDPDAAPHGGESMREVATRVAAWMNATLLAGRVNAITHPIVILFAILHALGLPEKDFRKVDVEFLSVTNLVRNDGRWSLQQRRLR